MPLQLANLLHRLHSSVAHIIGQQNKPGLSSDCCIYLGKSYWNSKILRKRIASEDFRRADHFPHTWRPGSLRDQVPKHRCW